MKTSIWDILTGITLLGILCLIAGFGFVILNPGMGLGLLPAAGNSDASVQLIPTIALPTDTETPIPQLPATWTPTPIDNAPTGDEGAPTLRPSSTPIPTNTPVVLPTFTATRRAATIGSGGSSTGANCTVVYQNPADKTVMQPGQSFNTRWTLRNNTSKSWDAGSVDITVISGDRLHYGSDLMDIPYSVGSNGGLIDLVISMVAPSAKGTYTEYWAIVAGSTRLCQFYVTIEVDD